MNEQYKPKPADIGEAVVYKEAISSESELFVSNNWLDKMRPEMILDSVKRY